jgi:hypothetical protein
VKKLKQKLKRKLKAIKALYDKVYTAVAANKLATLHTLLLLWLCVRVEQLHALFHLFSDILFSMAIELMFRVEAAQIQFAAAIMSILRLFGGEPA